MSQNNYTAKFSRRMFSGLLEKMNGQVFEAGLPEEWKEEIEAEGLKKKVRHKIRRETDRITGKKIEPEIAYLSVYLQLSCWMQKQMQKKEYLELLQQALCQLLTGVYARCEAALLRTGRKKLSFTDFRNFFAGEILWEMALKDVILRWWLPCLQSIDPEAAWKCTEKTRLFAAALSILLYSWKTGEETEESILKEIMKNIELVEMYQKRLVEEELHYLQVQRQLDHLNAILSETDSRKEADWYAGSGKRKTLNLFYMEGDRAYKSIWKEMCRTLDGSIQQKIRRLQKEWFGEEPDPYGVRCLLAAGSGSENNLLQWLGRQINVLLLAPDLGSARQQELGAELLLYAAGWMCTDTSWKDLNEFLSSLQKKTGSVQTPLWVKEERWQTLTEQEKAAVQFLFTLLSDPGTGRQMMKKLFLSRTLLKESLARSLAFLHGPVQLARIQRLMPVFAAQFACLLAAKREAVLLSPFLLLSTAQLDGKISFV